MLWPPEELPAVRGSIISGHMRELMNFARKIARTNVNVTVARSAYHPAPDKPLAGAGTILVKALVLIVATIWLLLITQAVRVRRACVGAQQPTTSSA